MDGLSGKTAVVTGAAGGIGLALAARFVQEGMRVVMADIEAAELDRAAELVGAPAGDVLAVPTDVSDRAAVTALADRTVQRFGAVDVLCNNAGVLGPATGMVWEIPPEEWRRVWSVNTLGIVNGIGAFVPVMLAAGRPAHIVNTASMQGLTTSTVACPYSASKHAALAVSESLRLQLRALGAPIGVSVLLPGAVRTTMMARATSHAARAGLPPPPPDAATLAVGGPVEYLEPAQIAQIVVRGIRDNRFYLFTHADSRQRIDERYGRVLADLT